MNILQIKIQTLEDAGKDRKTNIMPETVDNGVPVKNVTACILEDMTITHKSMVAIVLELEDGKFASGHITEGNFDALIKAYEGAKKRFSDLQKKRGFDPWD